MRRFFLPNLSNFLSFVNCMHFLPFCAIAFFANIALWGLGYKNFLSPSTEIFPCKSSFPWLIGALCVFRQSGSSLKPSHRRCLIRVIHGTSEVYSAVRTVARDTLGLTQPEQTSEEAEVGAASDNHQSREELKSGVWTFDLDQKLFESSISAIQVNLT